MESSLVVRIDGTSHSKVKQTILYRPELDVPIVDDVFAFEPPG
jgi:hypothetical protein